MIQTPRTNTSLPVVIIIKNIKEENWSKKNIGMGPTMTVKVGDMGDKNREGRRRRTNIEVVVFVKAVVGKKKYLVQL